MKKTLYLVIISCLYTKITFAVPHNTINTDEGSGAPISTLNADTLSKKNWAFSQRTEFYHTTPLSDSTLLESPNFESQTGLLINYLMLGYGVTENITFGINFPIQNGFQFRGLQMGDETSSPVISNFGNASGFSDTILFGLWSIAKADTNNFNIATTAIFGMNTPTGKTNAKMSTGELFSTSDQPGSGAVQPFGGIIFSKNWGKLALSTNFFHTQTTSGSQDTTLGSVFDYNFAGVYTLLKHYSDKGAKYSIDGVLELNGEYVAKDSISGINDPDSGGNTVIILPGVRINIGTNFSSYFSVAIPISQTLYGTQVKTTYAIFSGIDLLF